MEAPSGRVLAWLVVAAVLFAGPPATVDCPFRDDYGTVIVEPAGPRTDLNRSAAIPYRTLSAEGKRVLDRALPDGATTVCSEAGAPAEFSFTTGRPTLGDGRYVLEYRGDYYSVRTRAIGTDYGTAVLAGSWAIGLVAGAAAVAAYRRDDPDDGEGRPGKG